jgi:glycosyltransferase involved in cell wall biosynthesis
MKVLITRTMPEFSMDIYANGLIAGLKTVRPDWEIVAIAPTPLSRSSRSWQTRLHKYYERFWSFPRAVRQQTADIVHIIDHSDGHIAYALKNQSLNQPNQPTVITCHDLINYFYPQNLQGSVQIPWISNALWRRSIHGMKQANHIITVSQQTAHDVTQILGIPAARMTVVPNATSDFHPLSPLEREALRPQQLSPDTTCLLNVGSNHPRKNITTILQVVQHLKAQQIPIQFWKAGEDFTPEQKDWIQAHHLQSSVTYLGKPDQPTLMQFYNAADILLAPSTHEGFGITLLEAMACGTPVITANASAMPEVVGDAGVLIDPLNVEAIAAAILHIRRDDTYRQTLIQKGLERVKAFTWEAVAEAIAQIYESLLPQSTSTRQKVGQKVNL